jgi:hypothetical protein
MGLIITPLLLLLLWEDVENLIRNFQPKSTATQEPLYVEDLNRPMSDMHPLIKEQKDGEVLRRIYPYSVVDGGVHSVQELRSAMWRDPVVSRHYSNFKLSRARVIEAKADGDFHVSYRIGDEIFWTKKRLKVAKGEKLITDGTNFTRTRCANVLSEVIPGRTSREEPTPQVFDTPRLPSSDPKPFIPNVVTGGGPLDPGGPTPQVFGTPTLPPSGPAPFIPPVVMGGGLPTTSLLPSDLNPVIAGAGPLGPAGGNGENPSAPIPEPATLLLFASGLLGLAGYGRRKFFKKIKR